MTGPILLRRSTARPAAQEPSLAKGAVDRPECACIDIAATMVP